jgi:hypothetical protein
MELENGTLPIIVAFEKLSLPAGGKVTVKPRNTVEVNPSAVTVIVRVPSEAPGDIVIVTDSDVSVPLPTVAVTPLPLNDIDVAPARLVPVIVAGTELPITPVDGDMPVIFGNRANVAVQLRLADIVTAPSLQSASPLQDTKADPAAGTAVNKTDCPKGNEVLQVAPQLIPAGLLVTVPLPVPFLVIVSVTGGIEVNVQPDTALLHSCCTKYLCPLRSRLDPSPNRAPKAKLQRSAISPSSRVPKYQPLPNGSVNASIIS